jgi:hypothetical protein
MNFSHACKCNLIWTFFKNATQIGQTQVLDTELSFISRLDIVCDTRPLNCIDTSAPSNFFKPFWVHLIHIFDALSSDFSLNFDHIVKGFAIGYLASG